jgi:hypothetical protein
MAEKAGALLWSNPDKKVLAIRSEAQRALKEMIRGARRV